MALDTNLVCLAGIILFAAGSVLPWASMGDQGLMGFNTPVYPVASILLILAVAGTMTNFRFSEMMALAAAGLSFAVILYTFFTANNLIRYAQPGDVNIEYGLIISMLGTLAVCVSAVMGKGKY